METTVEVIGSLESVRRAEIERNKKPSLYALLGMQQPKRPLVEIVAEYFKVHPSDLATPFSKQDKTFKVMDARFFFTTYLAYEMDFGPMQVGYYVNRRHTSILHAERVVEVRISVEKEFREASLGILKEIEAAGGAELPKITRTNKKLHRKIFPFSLLLDANGRVKK